MFITHDLNEAMFLGDRIAVMRDGRIVQIGTPDDILTHPANDYVAQFVQDVDRTRVLTAGSVMEQARAVVDLSSGRHAERAADHARPADVGSLRGGPAPDPLRHGARPGCDASGRIAGAGPGRRGPQRHGPVRAETPLAELFGLAVEESPIPLPVVDDEGRLVGVIPRVTLLAALGNVPSSTTDIPIVESAPAPIPEQEVTRTLNKTSMDVKTSAEEGNPLMDLEFRIPLGDWVDIALRTGCLATFAGVFAFIRSVFLGAYDSLEWLLITPPSW